MAPVAGVPRSSAMQLRALKPRAGGDGPAHPLAAPMLTEEFAHAAYGSLYVRQEGGRSVVRFRDLVEGDIERMNENRHVVQWRGPGLPATPLRIETDGDGELRAVDLLGIGRFVRVDRDRHENNP